ncbi:monocarboxylate transporter 9-like isoform X3 [Ostrea edulis]|nr:monocarboxylate transporter 9-like isoform X3 [Ostrea edulis]
MKNNRSPTSHPVDRGWSWVILLALPILTFGLHHFSVRQIIVVGGFLGSVAYLIGFFADRIEIIILSHGVIYGMGFATLHGPAAFMIGTYFDRRRELANSILVAASGFGGLVLPPLYRYLLDVYGLQGAMLILSGIILNVVALAGFLKPPSLFQTLADKLNIEPSHKILSIREIQDDKGRPPLQNGKQRSISLSERAPSSEVENGGGWGSLPHRLDVRSHQISSPTRSVQSLGSTDAVYSFSQTQLSESSTDKQNRHKIIDVSLLKKPLLQLYMFVYCFGSIGSAYGHIFISPFARDHGISRNDISILISVTNLCDFIGRLTCGVIANQRMMKNSTLVAVSQIITGVILALCSFYGPFWSFIVLAIVYGLFSGAIFSMTPALIADFVGMENFRTSFGILILGQGITMGGGAPFLGYLRDVTQTYTTSFYFMGSLLLMSGLALLLEPCVRSRQENMESGKNDPEEVTLSV